MQGQSIRKQNPINPDLNIEETRMKQSDYDFDTSESTYLPLNNSS
jgi:hypothetical protein